MALRIECYIQGEEARGPIDLDASLARLRALLERVDGAQDTTVTLGLAATLSARQAGAAPDWDPKGVLGEVWRSASWVVYAPRDGDNTTDWNVYTAREGAGDALGSPESDAGGRRGAGR